MYFICVCHAFVILYEESHILSKENDCMQLKNKQVCVKDLSHRHSLCVTAEELNGVRKDDYRFRLI